MSVPATLPSVDGRAPRLSLDRAAARKLTTTVKSAPQMQGTSPRWLLRMLPWVDVSGATYRVTRRLSFPLGGGRVRFVPEGARVEVAAPSLRELSPLASVDDDDAVGALARAFVQRDVDAGEVIAAAGQPLDRVVVVVHGVVRRLGGGEFGGDTLLGHLGEGDLAGDRALLPAPGWWDATLTAATPCTLLELRRAAVERVLRRSGTLRASLEQAGALKPRPRNRQGEASIDIASGHAGEPSLCGTFVDYEAAPREYPLAVAQTRLRVHTRVADLYNDPMDQLEEQLRLTVEALREREESELLVNPDFGLLHNVDPRQRVRSRTGPPTPEDLDQLLARRRKSRLLLAHPRAIAAFGRECTRQHIDPGTVEVSGRRVHAWRGVPMLPSDKIPVSETQRSSIIAMRTGEKDEGVIGLHQTGIPDEREPGLSVRCTGVDEHGIASYLVSAHFSVAVLVPDALGVLENVVVA